MQCTGLWLIPLSEDAMAPPANFLPQTDNLFANVSATSSAAKYARYIHQLLCSPLAATLLLALDKSNELRTIPGLTPQLSRTHLPCSTATDKGLMRHHRANTASTRNIHANVLLA